MTHLSYVQYTAMTIAGIISATLSLIGSSLILFLARTKWRKEPLHRMVSWLSVTDILFTLFGVYAQVWFTPQDSPLNLYWAHGNRSTCTLVGAISSWLRVAGSLLNCSLSIYFLLIVKYGWRNETIQWKMEYPAYVITIILPTLFLVAGLKVDAYTVVPILNICILTQSSHDNGDPTCVTDTPSSTECRGVERNSEQLPIGSLSSLVIIIATIIGFFCTFLVYWRVRRQMRMTRRCSMTGLGGALATEVAWQSIWYSLAYLNTFIWPVLLLPVLLKQDSNVIDRTGETGLYTLSFLLWFFLPLQGALNCIIYIRPQYREWLKFLPPGTHRWDILQRILSGTEFPSRSSRHSGWNNGRGRSSMKLAAAAAAASCSFNVSQYDNSRPMSATEESSTAGPPPPGLLLLVGEKDEVIISPSSLQISNKRIRFEEENDIILNSTTDPNGNTEEVSATMTIIITDLSEGRPPSQEEMRTSPTTGKEFRLDQKTNDDEEEQPQQPNYSSLPESIQPNTIQVSSSKIDLPIG